jgi:anti-anti-sigma factor
VREPFSATIDRDDEAVIVELHGALDATTTWRLDRYVDALLDAGETRLVLHLEHVVGIDVAWIAALVDAVQRIHEVGGEVALRAPSPRAEETLERGGITLMTDVVTGT